MIQVWAREENSLPELVADTTRLQSRDTSRSRGESPTAKQRSIRRSDPSSGHVSSFSPDIIHRWGDGHAANPLRLQVWDMWQRAWSTICNLQNKSPRMG
jgi:hypothetical protein